MYCVEAHSPLPFSLVLVAWCFCGASQSGFHTSAITAPVPLPGWWWVAGAGWDGLIHLRVTLELLLLEIKDCASQGAGPSIYVRGKMKSVCFAALQLQEWDGFSPRTKKPSRAVAWCHID